ncbi:MAG: hypothetical protein JNL80_16825, partial [Phycisphaerae bacterium]|nr:hypothetical protein [Phycisphaerae bacterium]
MLFSSVAILIVACVPLAAPPTASQTDWLVNASAFVAEVKVADGASSVTLTNGLLRRTIRLSPNAATVAFDNLMTDAAELRSVRPEATVTIDGKTIPVGGLKGQDVHNFLRPESLDQLTAIDGAFAYTGHRIGRTQERFAWRPRPQWLSRPVAWPPPGVSLELDFRPADSAPSGVTVTVHYELYDAIPLLSKWITVDNGGSSPITLDAFCSELLAWVEPASLVGGSAADFAAYPRSIHVESEYAFGGTMENATSAPSVRWVDDPLYATQVHYDRHTPCLLECGPTVGPRVTLAPGDRFESPRVFELLFDSTDRERRGLAQRRMYRTIAPWVQENPLIFHAGS